MDEALLTAGVGGLASPASCQRPAGTLRDEEVRLIEEALEACEGRVSGTAGAAARLGIPPTTLESKIKRLGIRKNRFRR